MEFPGEAQRETYILKRKKDYYTCKSGKNKGATAAIAWIGN